MWQVDSLPKAWRDLVNEYGHSATMKFMRETNGLAEAHATLIAWRARRQMESA